MKKALIVGGSGFVGLNLIKNLNKNNNYKIFSTIHKNYNFTKFAKVKYFKGDLLNYNFCKKITKNIDEVYMCSAYTAGAKIINKNPMEFVHENTLMNLNLLKASANNNIKVFIFLSSTVVYPDTKKEVSEDDVNFTFFHKYNNVAWMKIYSEKVCEMYKNKFKILIIRPSNLYGPYEKFDKDKSKVIPSLIRKFENNKIVKVWGDGKEKRDFIYIDDFIRILLKIKSKSFNFLILNVASGKIYSINKLIRIIKTNYPKKKVKFLSNRLKMIAVRKINNSKMKQLINFKLKYSLDKGIKETIDWYKKYKMNI